MKDSEIDAKLEALNTISYNNGGSFCFFRIENEANALAEERIKSYLLTPDPRIGLDQRRLSRISQGLEKFLLEKIEDWKEEVKSALDHWLYFKNPYSPPLLDEEKLRHERIEFEDNFREFVAKNSLIRAYRISEKFNSYDTPWGDQMNTDLVFEFDKRIYIFHMGWSS
ncbi:MAG: hypothetical protein ACJ75J_11420 [Cytophagaceae bacterium]